jgi:alpha-amylase/alpha-mannosidase (GH57 family)
MSTNRHLCIHGHFYQPPRENPWLEAVQLQDSAYPFHDWNQRITEECYGPNARSRILASDGLIDRIVNNYAHISFNFGPTLLSWLEAKEPEVYRAILEADARSRERYGGHGNALAQAHCHPILPLCNDRDLRTQVRWGVRDFEHRFGRRPEGMWLPETAVDVRSLEALAAEGVAFTILEPHQALRWRAVGEKGWCEVGTHGLDTRRPYLCRLPSGRSIAIFFYDGPVSRAVAFERLLSSGEAFAGRVLGLLDGDPTEPQLAHIATDGETYGHHHRHGDMALAYALRHVQEHGLAQPIHYAAFLERYPPRHEVEVAPNTSWSCVHGVERWRADCGCNTGINGGFRQGWRAPLRAALDWLRDVLAPYYEREAAELLSDPWAARDDYIDVVLDRAEGRSDAFLDRHRRRPFDVGERVRVWRLLEMQRHAMLMYTSCGWFFDDLSGIETVQVLRYAARAVQLAEGLFEVPFEAELVNRLSHARSNLPAEGDGRSLWQRRVRPSVVSLEDVGAHYVVSSLFDPYEEDARVYCYAARSGERTVMEQGQARLLAGKVRIASGVTGEHADLEYAAVHFGAHNLSAGVRRAGSEDAYAAMCADVTRAFERADVPEVVRKLDQHFDGGTGAIYSLGSLFRDEQRRIIDRILQSSFAQAEAGYRSIYAQHGPLMRFLVDLGAPVPRAFAAAAEFVINQSLRQALSADVPDLEHVKALLAEAARLSVELDHRGLARVLEQSMGRLARLSAEMPGDLPILRHLLETVQLARDLPFDVDLWDVQNVFFTLTQRVWPARQKEERAGHGGVAPWCDVFRSLGAALGMRVPEPIGGE